MITLGTATKEDIGELMSLHEALRLRYSRTVLCSCLIVLREGEAVDAGGVKKDAPQVGRPIHGCKITGEFYLEKTFADYSAVDK